MIVNEDAVQAFNSRVRVDLNNIKKMTAGQLDRVKNYGSQAEVLLSNRDFVQFVHHWKFDMLDTITTIAGHTEEDNTRRIALCNQLSGMDSFVASLQRARYFKEKVVSQQTPAQEVDPNL